MAKKPAPKKPAPKKKRPSREARDEAADVRKAQKRLESEEGHAKSAAEEMYGDGSLGRLDDPSEIGMVSNIMEGGSESVAQSEDAYNKSQVRDAYVTDALERMKSGLGGYTDTEQNAQRAIAGRAVKSQEATNLRALKSQQAENGVSGTSAIRLQNQIRNQAMLALSGQATDLVAANADEQRKRLSDYGSFADTSYGTHERVKSDALKTLMGARKDVADYRFNADVINTGSQATNIQNRSNADKYNLEQRAKEKAGYAGTYYGDIGVQDSMVNRMIADRLARRAQDIAAKGMR